MLMNRVNAESLICSSCGGARVSETLEDQKFPYGVAPSTVTLTAKVPVKSCSDCGYQVTDERAEQARHAAICEYLGRLAPAQIVEIRNRHFMGRSDFAEIGKFGIASLQRWETGALIQNEANDRLIYLLQFSENVSRLKNYQPVVLRESYSATEITSASVRRRRSFRHLRDNQQVQTIASRWELRRS